MDEEAQLQRAIALSMQEVAPPPAKKQRPAQPKKGPVEVIELDDDDEPSLCSTRPGQQPPVAKVEPLTLLSYNVWFAYPETFRRRMTALAGIADKSSPRPAVLAMQEVTPSNMGVLRPLLREAGYHEIFEQQEGLGHNGQETYYVALAMRAPLGCPIGSRFVEFGSSRMGRGLLLARATWEGVGQIVVGTTHLESFIGPAENEQIKRARRQQLQQATRLLEREAQQHGCAAAVLLGDFNLNNEDDKEGNVLDGLSSGWHDAWEEVGRPKAAKATCGWSWRLDRCFVFPVSGHQAAGRTLGSASGSSSSGPRSLAVRAASVALVGQSPIPGEYYDYDDRRKGTTIRKELPVSDHKGLLVTLEARPR